MRVTAVTLLALAALHARADAGACAGVQRLTPHVLNPPLGSGDVPPRRKLAPMPADGGVVVASLPVAESGPPPSRFGDDVTSLAPGLVLYKSAPDKDAPNPPRVPAPAIKRVTFTPGTGMHGRTSIVAELTTKPPDGVLALIVFDAGKGHAPRSWGLVESTGETEVTVYSSGGRCVETIPDLVPSGVGDRVVLAWVDAYGRLSKLSNPVTVSKAR